MTFEEWWEARQFNPHDVYNDCSDAWEAGHNEGFKDYKDKIEGDQYVLVPVEPTEAMIDAIENALLDMGSTLKVVDIYKAMIQVAQEEES